ncbi:hypothetical protein [Desulfovibrio cuneatus]|uniref:hypothetical protein n=1 Tax=Desulfovibrio cuneatus TaxID=159728 RepID=UPI0003FD4B97|nr:hypothetical protein [Desulfovibrio cuneatus]
MRTVLFIPSLTWLSGGLATLYRLAATLAGLGHSVATTAMRPNIPGLEELTAQGIPFMDFASLQLSPNDIWLVPESHPNAIAKGVEGGARTVVYVQNWYYMLTGLPQGVQWGNLPVSFLSVSRPVSWFMQKTLGVRPIAELPPVIAPCFFAAPAARPGHIRIATMPRKNPAMARQMRDVAEACLARHGRIPLEWVTLHNMPQEAVATTLASCHIYLSTGFPEGFGLPPAEAMACGCVPVGCTGFGGWEFMRPVQPGTFTVPFLEDVCPAVPPYPLPLEPANGFFTADGDTLAGGMALAAAVLLAMRQPAAHQALAQAGQHTALRYTEQTQKQTVAHIWDMLKETSI